MVDLTPDELTWLEQRLRPRSFTTTPGTSVSTPAPATEGPLAPLEPKPFDLPGGPLGQLAEFAITPLVDVPELPGPLGELVEQGLETTLSPIGLASVALVPFTGGTSLGLAGALGTTARIGTRLGGEILISGAATLAASEASQRLENAPEAIQLLGTLGAGLGVGLTAGRGLRALSPGTITPQAAIGPGGPALVNAKLTARLTEVPLAPGIERTLQRVGNTWNPVPPELRRLFRFTPTRQMAALISPRLRIDRHIQEAYLGEGDVMAVIQMEATSTARPLLNQLKQLFGGDTRANVQYIGGPRQLGGRLVAPDDFRTAKGTLITGTIADIVENPTLYQLTPDQLAWVSAWEARRLALRDLLNTDYAANMATITNPGGGYLPLVAKGDNASATAYHEIRTAARAGATQQIPSETIAQRLAVDDTFEPLLDMPELVWAMDSAHAYEAGRRTLIAGLGGSGTPAPGLVHVDELGRYFPAAQAKQIKNILELSNNEIIKQLNNWRGTVLALDGSPLFGIQGPLALMWDPIGSSRALASGLRNPREFFRTAFSRTQFADDVRADPDGWRHFSEDIGIAIGAAPPTEFASEWLRLGPGFLRANEAMFIAVTRMMRRQYDEVLELTRRMGLAEDVARAEAGAAVTKMLPLFNPRRAGLSARQAALQRASVTSISYLRQPIAFMADGIRGVLKMANPRGLAGPSRWTTMTPAERIAVVYLSRFAGTGLGLSAISAVLSAEERGLSVDEALDRVLNPTSSEFMSLIVGTKARIPIGGPYRAWVRAIWPKDGVPLAGIPQFVRGRLGPGYATAYGLATNTDYFGEEIRSGDAFEQLLGSFSFLAENSLPLSLRAAVIEGGFQGVTAGAGALGLGTPEARQRVESLAARRQLDADEIFFESVAGLLGSPALGYSDFESREGARRAGFNRLKMGNYAPADLAPWLTPEQAALFPSATSPDALRDLIGSRAANAIMEAANATDFLHQQENYIASLDRRADRGDRDAQALLIGIHTQQRLDALRVASEGDKARYRADRNTIKAEQRGEMSAYEDIFNAMRRSGPVDRDTEAWFALMDLARRDDGLFDSETFDLLERFFTGTEGERLQLGGRTITAIGPARFALVEDNIQGPRIGENVWEQELRLVRTNLEATGFFDLDERAWQQIRDLTRVRHGAENYQAYREAEIPRLMAEARRYARSDADAREEAERAFARDPLVRRYGELRNNLEMQWALSARSIPVATEAGFVPLPDAAREWGYWSATIEQRIALGFGQRPLD